MANVTQNGDWATRVKRLWMLGTSSNGATEDVFAFDAVLRESHHSELTVTDNPVETGVVISDHAYMAPVRLEIEAVVSDVFFGTVDASGNTLPPTGSDAFQSAAGRAQAAFTLLQALQSAATPFKVQSGLRLYENMLIASLDADQDARTGNILKFRASLREVIFVSTQTVDYPPRKPGKTTNSGSKTASKGEKKTAAVTEVAKQQSILKQLTSGDTAGALSALGNL